MAKGISFITIKNSDTKIKFKKINKKRTRIQMSLDIGEINKNWKSDGFNENNNIIKDFNNCRSSNRKI